MRPEPYDIQGRFLRMPYDWRVPTLSRIRRRLWNPGGPLLAPKIWGWGFSFNLAHPGARVVLVAMGLFVAAMIALGGAVR